MAQPSVILGTKESFEMKKKTLTSKIEAVFSIGDMVLSFIFLYIYFLNSENLEDSLLVAESKKTCIKFPVFLIGDNPFRVELLTRSTKPQMVNLEESCFVIGLANNSPNDLYVSAK